MEKVKCELCGKLKPNEKVTHRLDLPQCHDINTAFYAERICDRCFARYVWHVMNLRKELRNER